MRDGLPAALVHTSHAVRTVVSAWRDGEQLAESVPLDAGTLDLTADAQIPGRLDLTCPSVWAPRRASDPLAVYGQRLQVSQILRLGVTEWTIPLGWYLVQAWDHAPPAVEVEALTLEQLLADARLVSPYQRPAGATLASTLRDLCSGILPVDVSALTDRPLPAGLTDDWLEDRLAAVRAVQEAWPADLRVDDDGVLVATPVRTVAAQPHVTWRHGAADAYVSAGGGGLRDAMHNAVVARGEASDGTPVQALAYDSDAASPTHYLGPFGRRPRFYESPLITTTAQAQATARTLLARELRRTATVTVQAPPDPRVELLDTARVVLDTGESFAGLVTEISLPLVAADGPASYVVGLVGG